MGGAAGGVLGAWGVGGLHGWDWGQGGTASSNTVDVFLGGEYLCPGTVVGVVYCFSPTVEPNVGLSRIDLSECCLVLWAEPLPFCHWQLPSAHNVVGQILAE